jgi:hypothetical protein
MSGPGAKVVAGAILIAAAVVAVAIAGQAAGHGEPGTIAGLVSGIGGLALLIFGFVGKGKERR